MTATGQRLFFQPFRLTEGRDRDWRGCKESFIKALDKNGNFFKRSLLDSKWKCASRFEKQEFTSLRGEGSGIFTLRSSADG